MNYSIIGSGSVGMALASQFARSAIPVSIANRRGPDSLISATKKYADYVHPLHLQTALDADIIILAVPFPAHKDIAATRKEWQGKIVIDVTNAWGIPLSELDNQPSSAIVAKALPGAHLVKAFNHLPAAILAQVPVISGRRRVIFVSGDDEGANTTASELVSQLGYSPVSLGKIAEGGQLVQARYKQWAPLIFQDLFKEDK
ncbi:NADP oxidoreductase coenzyme [Izhakiella australiensis]|uniref:NADP oxidoreductase coenzyme n=2 Tax=Izhakiella australiensis TaxID=1926881 RepID=A0A1S8YND3_9GAMM|nr:NADPH-dependent F420 reductase [Izhakiella australiensis]OON40153.1 NADP oxidoreductase coenzyme [Izhakiella australiensis]